MTGNIYNLVNVALNYVQERIDWRVEVGARKREEVPEIPLDALREIIANSFAHEDYEVGEGIQISIHPGSVEIYNPGSFPGGLTPFDFIDNNLPSYFRNLTILDVLFRSKDVEKAETGFQRANELCINNKTQWEFSKEGYGFTFKFLRKRQGDAESEENGVELGSNKKAVFELISSLIVKGLVVRIGSNKGGYWAKKKD